ncbi:MAG TPA: dTDP-4-dehydrorhamnose 3,5-epimerase [Steroidobacteraceae bacterium]|nr:dTDP-4-dehydrorhamnose 3,5-epimerase [Steroidobacteraceae bacterium]
MNFEPLAIAEVILIRPRVFADVRGYFLESWEERKFAAAGIEARFVQDNHSRSVRHVLRGLHYQLRHPQGKLVRVVAGTALDVALDLRRSSPTFGRWVGQILSEENHHMLWVPPGFAHGYLALSDRVDFLYRCTDFYAPNDEHTVLWNDPDLAIEWQLPHGVEPLLSGKDAAGVRVRNAECYA